MQIRMIVTRDPDELDIPNQESLYHATGKQVDVTGQRRVDDGWEFFPETVDEYAGGYAIEDGDPDTSMVWLDIPDADLPLYESAGQDVSDTRMFLDVIEVNNA